MVDARVLHVVDTFGARSETFVYAYVTGHTTFEASVVCRARENPTDFPFDRISVVPEVWSRAHPERWISAALGCMTGRTLWQRRIEPVVTSRRPAVVHAHFGQVAARVLPVVLRLRLPLVTSFYGYDATAFAQTSAGRRSLAPLFHVGALFLAEGPVMQQRLIDIGAPADRVRVVPIGVDLSRYPRWHPDREAPRVLFVSRFVEKKGLPDAIHAFAKAYARMPTLRLRIVGDGPERARGLQVAQEMDIAHAIEWLGPQPHRVVIDELRQAAVFLQPSLTAANGDSEGGAPTTVIEAQAVGVPVVTTRHADIPNVVAEGKAVRLVAERDVDGLANGIVDLASQMHASDSPHVRQRHDIRNVVQTLESCYRDVVDPC
jgi:colanic acid/amylovoran biosynthesis glycosyltransferase